MASQAPIKVRPDTKERIRYLSAIQDASQAEIVDRAVTEYAVRHASDIERGIARAHEVLAAGPAATAAYILDIPPEVAARVSNQPASRT